MQDQLTAVALKHPCSSSREIKGLQGEGEKHRPGHTKQDPARKYVVFILHVMLYDLKQNNTALKKLFLYVFFSLWDHCVVPECNSDSVTLH